MPEVQIKQIKSVLTIVDGKVVGAVAVSGLPEMEDIEVAQWLEGVLGRELEGMVYRAGTFAPVAG